jgi:UPF0755 protein
MTPAGNRDPDARDADRGAGGARPTLATRGRPRIRGIWFPRDLAIVVACAALVFLVVSQASWLLSVRELDKRTLVEIASGLNVRQIARSLEEQGIIRDASKFVMASRVFRAANRIQAGVYEFGPEYSELEVLLALKHGEVAGRTVTIPEGYRATQIAALLDGMLDVPAAELMDLVHDPALASSLGVSAPSLEGYLHPETYRVRLDATPREIVVMMVDETMRLLDFRKAARAESLGLSVHEILTLASIIEMEAMLDAERARISAVYHNRLERGWKLEADPTVRYAIGKFRRRLYYKDLDVDSPYNTYRRAGLPPGPICSPGKASIEAALHPAPRSDEFFFVANGDGTHTFSETFAEHVKARRRIARGREAKEFSLDSGDGG